MINSKKIYIKAYTRLNVGDDLFVFILCARYPKYQFYIKEQMPYTNVFKTIQNLSLIEEIDNTTYDAIVYIGGSIFIESAGTSILRLLDLKNEIVKPNIPTYIIGANFGPYTSKEYFLTAKNDLFPHIKSITFRDKYSYDLFKDMNNVHYAPDVVFTIDTTKIEKTKNKEIGISIIHHLERENLKIHYDEYINKLLEISRYYISNGYTIRLFSFCEYEKDMIAIHDFSSKLTKQELQHVVVSNYTGNIYEILSKISGLKLFIASRFHSIILGLKFRIPTIPICYSSKSTNVLNDISFPASNIFTFENLDSLNINYVPEVFSKELSSKAMKQFNDLDML